MLLVSGVRDWLYLLVPSKKVSPEDGDIIRSPKRPVSNKRQDDGDNVQNCDSYTIIIIHPLSTV
jgi:hypothetical protein